MINKVADFIGECQLLSHDDLHVVALSGGADSVALLRVLLQLGYRVEAAHCNFHLRGKESDRDEQFSKNLCEKLGIKFHLIHFDTTTYAELHQVSIEMAARDLRYHYFHQLAGDIGASTVCVAHHQDDAIETMLINLLRGTGIHGLTGMRPRNGIVVRPLLCVSRAEILDYLTHCGQDYVTDSTNLVPDVLRNKIRLQLLPLMEQINPAVRASLLTTARNMAEAEKVYDQAIKESLECRVESLEFAAAIPSAERLQVGASAGIGTAAANSSLFTLHSSLNNSSLFTLHSSLLTQLPSPEAFLHEWLSPLGFTPAQTQQLAKLTSTLTSTSTGKTFASATHELLVDRDAIIVQPIMPEVNPMKIPEPGCYQFTSTPNKFNVKVNVKVSVKLETGSHIIKESTRAGIDAGKVRFPLTLRPVQAGDRFQPFGMKGSRLVSDYLTDLKCNLFEKRRQLVLTDTTGCILWVVGHRTAQPFCVTPDTTQTLVLEVNISNNQ